MGIFDTLKSEVRIDNTRLDDKPGVYWQRIDSISTPMSQSGQEYIRIAKTTVEVIDDRAGAAHEVGTETTQALFRDKYNYLEKDLMKITKAIFGMSDEEASNLSGAEMSELLMSDDAVGQVVKVEVNQLVSKKGEPFVKHRWHENRDLEAE